MLDPTHVLLPIGDRPSRATLYYGADCVETLRGLPEGSVHCCVTSPPYWGLRDYGTGEAQIGLEATPEEYVEKLVQVFREVRRVLRDDGTVWLNLGDSYAQAKTGAEDIGLKPKNLVGMPWRVAFALQADGWYLRSDIIWAKGSVMPESVEDRPTKAHEYMFLLSKSQYYFYDAVAVREDGRHVKEKDFEITTGRNQRSWWIINPQPYKGAHFAVFPPKLCEPCILASTSARGCCPSCGASWVREFRREIDPDRTPARRNILPPELTKAGQGTNAQGSSTWGHHLRTITEGWKPGCSCGKIETIPCIVLDPFSGSATAGKVALDHGRDFIGIDLNRDYLELACARLLEEPPIKDEGATLPVLEMMGSSE